MTSTPQEIAEWMVAEVEVQGFLFQEKAVRHITEHFGEEFTYWNDAGDHAIARPVLMAFRRMTEGTVIWDRWEKCWRFRGGGDASGRDIS